jgi:hypothetical protein
MQTPNSSMFHCCSAIESVERGGKLTLRTQVKQDFTRNIRRANEACMLYHTPNISSAAPSSKK